MKSNRFEPTKALRSFWMTIWSIWLLIGIFLGSIPFLLQTLFGVRIEGALPTIITLALLLLFMVPMGIWLPAYHRSIEYEIDSKVVRSRRGVFWKKVTTVPFHKITNVDVTQGPIQRLFGIGTIHVQTAGAGGSQGGQAELLLQGMVDLEKLRDAIISRSLEAGGGRGSEEPLHSEEPILEELRRIRILLESGRR